MERFDAGLLFILTEAGVDIELPAVRRRIDLRRRVLTENECGDLGRLSGLSEDEDVLLRFSMKEAVYKAAHPVLRRTMVFKDVSRKILQFILICISAISVRSILW